MFSDANAYITLHSHEHLVHSFKVVFRCMTGNMLILRTPFSSLMSA